MDKVEGLLLNKFPYQDKHVIAHLLLRNGLKLSVVFYGAQGGGKNNKGSILQLGHLFSVNFNQNKSNFEMITAKEYQEKWQHKSLAIIPRAFYLLCFYCELLEKVATPAGSLDDLELDVEINGGLFRLLSNSLFYLEKDCEQGVFNYERSLFIFLVKALVELGIFPQTKSCCISGVIFENQDGVHLLSEKGGFAHIHFIGSEESRLIDPELGRLMRLLMMDISLKKFSEIDLANNYSHAMSRQIFSYLCYQLHMKASDFKTASLVF